VRASEEEGGYNSSRIGTQTVVAPDFSAVFRSSRVPGINLPTVSMPTALDVPFVSHRSAPQRIKPRGNRVPALIPAGVIP
jgi:hypothetical protein